MRLDHILEQLEEALASEYVTDESSIIALVVDSAATTPEAVSWSEVPIVEVYVNDEDREVLLQRDDTDGSVALTVPELIACLRTLVPDWLECPVLVAHDEELEDGWMRTGHSPLVSVAINREQRAFGLVPWFEGWEQFFD